MNAVYAVDAISALLKMEFFYMQCRIVFFHISTITITSKSRNKFYYNGPHLKQGWKCKIHYAYNNNFSRFNNLFPLFYYIQTDKSVRYEAGMPIVQTLIEFYRVITQSIVFLCQMKKSMSTLVEKSSWKQGLCVFSKRYRCHTSIQLLCLPINT